MKQQRAKPREAGSPAVLEFYAQPGPMTAPGRHAAALAKLPGDVASLAEVIQGLAIHQYMADAYGFKVPERRTVESHIRAADRILDQILALDDRPLTLARPPEKRVVGVCHHFALLMTAMLQAKGIPARYRCGFGAFFNPPWFEDHVLCEYWNADDARWVQLDPQLDAVWRGALKFQFDPLDVPRDQFLQSTDAWTLCRSGKVDPGKFGIFVGDLRGSWFIAASLVRDVAALGKMEMLPWDCWGVMPHQGQELDAGQLAFFDRLAALTVQPDASHQELRALDEKDERVRVPKTVFNAVLKRTETV
ncbi:MAG TPA: transglutaminase-like domain-containing protein [Dongiaceae bacterium]|nr:transglutaminase-like domain-containing protein [Dongiaceae bacterium]